MESIINVHHQTITVEVEFDRFRQQLEKLVGHITAEDIRNIATDPVGTEKHLEMLGGYQDLILFSFQDHGALFNFTGNPEKQYNT